MSWGWLDTLGQLNIPKILSILGMVGGALLSIGAAMSAPKAKTPGLRKQLWVLCAMGCYVGGMMGLTAWNVVRGPWFYVLWIPVWAATAWMFINRKSMKATA